jgi:hypothetical protein
MHHPKGGAPWCCASVVGGPYAHTEIHLSLNTTDFFEALHLLASSVQSNSSPSSLIELFVGGVSVCVLIIYKLVYYYNCAVINFSFQLFYRCRYGVCYNNITDIAVTSPYCEADAS